MGKLKDSWKQSKLELLIKNLNNTFTNTYTHTHIVRINIEILKKIKIVW